MKNASCEHGGAKQGYLTALMMARTNGRSEEERLLLAHAKEAGKSES